MTNQGVRMGVLGAARLSALVAGALIQGCGNLDDETTQPTEYVAEDLGSSDGDDAVSEDAISEPPRLSAHSGCSRHADCASLVCNPYAALRGRCIHTARVLYVSSQCTDPSAATGSLDNPFCQIRDAVAASESSDRDVIRVLPGSYLPFAVQGRRLRIFGPAGEGGVAQVFEEDGGAVQALAGADVLVDGIDLGGPTRSALRCEGARAVVRRGTLRSDVGSAAVQATGCELRLDRTSVRTALTGIELTDTRFKITNTFITGATERVAIIVHSGEGTFRFVTVTGNYKETSALGPIDCGNADVLFQDSIVAGNRAYGDSGSQFRGSCDLQRVVVGSDTIAAPGAIHLTPTLVDGYRLPYSAENLQCCIDRAALAKSIRWDIEGTLRPQGPRSDLGAFEAAVP